MKRILKQSDDVAAGLLQSLHLLVSDWSAQLAHGGDDVGGQALDVHCVAGRLLANQLHVQHLRDLGPHPIGPRVQEGK